jgi:DnaJ-class molecular chaperone
MKSLRLKKKRDILQVHLERRLISSRGSQPVCDENEILQVGRGMPILTSTGRGDLLVRFRVIIPRKR